MKWDEYVKGMAHVKLFLKGRPRCGKTYLAASATKLGRTLYVEVEGGLISAHHVVDKENLEIEFIPITDPELFTKKLDTVMSRIMTEKFDWVVIDSFTEIIGHLESQYTRSDGETKDWMTIIEKAKKLGRFLRDGDFNCIITCLMDSNFEPVLPGKASTIIPSFYNTTAMIETRTFNGQEARVLVSSGMAAHAIGDRFNILEPFEIIDKDHPEKVLQKLLTGIQSISQ